MNSYDRSKNLSSEAKKIICPRCGNGLRRIQGRSGFFWGCTGYPVCKQTINDRKGKPLISLTACTVCKTGKLVRKKGKFGIFFGCSNYPNCKAKYTKDPNETLYKIEVEVLKDEMVLLD